MPKAKETKWICEHCSARNFRIKRLTCANCGAPRITGEAGNTDWYKRKLKRLEENQKKLDDMLTPPPTE